MKKVAVLLIFMLFIFAIISCVDETYHIHNWVEPTIVKEPSCEDEGMMKFVCSCGEVKTESINPLGHGYVDGVCTRCHNKKEDVDNAGARIGSVYYVSLKEALIDAKSDDVITMLKDFEYTDESEMSDKKALKITVPCTLDGNNKRILCSIEQNNNDNRLLDIDGLSDGVLSIKNLSISSETFSGYFRGINIGACQNTVINLNNVDIDIPDYYAINITPDNDQLSIYMENGCEIKGWSTIYNHGTNVKLNAKDCVFDSSNNQNSGGDSNSFASVIVAEYYDIDGAGVYFSNDNSFSFDNCTFSAKKQDGTDVTQVVFDIRCSNNNSLKLNGCTFKQTAEPFNFQTAVDSTFCDDMEKRKAMMFTNTILLDGVNITNDSSLVEQYIDTYITKETGFENYKYPFNIIPLLYGVKEGESEVEVVRKLEDGKNYTITASEDNGVWSIQYTELSE